MRRRPSRAAGAARAAALTRAAALGAAGVALVACGNPSPPPPGNPASVAPESDQVEGAPTLTPGAQSPSPESGTDAVTRVQVLALEVEGGQPAGGVEEMYEALVGVPITFEITTDTAGTVIVNGTPAREEVTPGQTLRFEALFDTPGSFEVTFVANGDTAIASVSVR